jgi:hypothetical protein
MVNTKPDRFNILDFPTEPKTWRAQDHDDKVS